MSSNAPGDQDLCYLHNDLGSDAEMNANARLIAAAPDLLAACLAHQAAIYDYLEGEDGEARDLAQKLIDAAVRKATGLDRP